MEIKDKIDHLTRAVTELSHQIKTIATGQSRLQRSINQLAERQQGYKQLSLIPDELPPGAFDELPGQAKIPFSKIEPKLLKEMLFRKYKIKAQELPVIFKSDATAFDTVPQTSAKGTTYKFYISGSTRSGDAIKAQFFKNFTSHKEALCWAVMLGRKYKMEYAQANPTLSIRDRKFNIGILSHITVTPNNPYGKIMRGRRYEFDPGDFEDEVITFTRQSHKERSIGANVTAKRIRAYCDKFVEVKLCN